MSQITVVFEDLREMKDFARGLLGKEPGAADGCCGDGLSTKALQAVQEQSLSYGQQIAEHFPAANKSVQQAPVSQQPIAPVQQPVPQQTAPVQQPTPQQTAPVQQPIPQQAVQTTAQTYQLEDLSRAAMQLMDKGMQEQLQQLLAGYGVESLPGLPAEQYGNFATALRGLGAQI